MTLTKHDTEGEGSTAQFIEEMLHRAKRFSLIRASRKKNR